MTDHSLNIEVPTSCSSNNMSSLKEICSGLPVNPLPELRPRDDTLPHAPVRTPNLTVAEEKVFPYLMQHNPIALEFWKRNCKLLFDQR